MRQVIKNPYFFYFLASLACYVNKRNKLRSNILWALGTQLTLSCNVCALTFKAYTSFKVFVASRWEYDDCWYVDIFIWQKHMMKVSAKRKPITQKRNLLRRNDVEKVHYNQIKKEGYPFIQSFVHCGNKCWNEKIYCFKLHYKQLGQVNVDDATYVGFSEGINVLLFRVCKFVKSFSGIIYTSNNITK